VTQGFIGATISGETTTIGRGGSDYSAAILGSVLDAEEIQIWTDVDGILTADPTILPNSFRIKQMTFREAAELAYFGARVLHPKTILPAVEKGIPVRVLNSRRPDSTGTLITARSPEPSGCVVKSVAYKEGITLVSIESTRMLMAHGFLARLFEVFAQFRKPVDVIATSEIGVSLTVDDSSGLDEIVHTLREVAEVTVQPHRAVLCVVGENMKYTRGIAAKVFTALDRVGVNVELISHGGSEINLTLVIREEEIRTAVEALHAEFFSNAHEMVDLFQ
jgi:aspartate kinase